MRRLVLTWTLSLLTVAGAVLTLPTDGTAAGLGFYECILDGDLSGPVLPECPYQNPVEPTDYLCGMCYYECWLNGWDLEDPDEICLRNTLTETSSCEYDSECLGWEYIGVCAEELWFQDNDLCGDPG
jgi:hypothetical protein